MSGDEKISMAVERARGVWLMLMVAATFIIGVLFPIFYLMFLIPIGIVLYYTTLLVTVKYLQQSLTYSDFPDEHAEKVREIQEKVASGELKPGKELDEALLKAAGGAKVGRVEAASEQIGSVDGTAIYEWVEIKDIGTQEVMRFTYHSVVQRAPDGSTILPVEKDKHFAQVENCIYEKNVAST
jgi:hypothetical protein